MKLNILSLKGPEFDGDVISFNVKTANGEITVMDNHRPLITILKKGTAVIKEKGGAKKEISINSGFLEMSRNNTLNVLID